MVQLAKCSICLKIANPFNQGVEPFHFYQPIQTEVRDQLIVYCNTCKESLSTEDRAELNEKYEQIEG